MNILQGKNITLIVTGSIAAYKSAELVRELVKAEANVHVILTAAAQEFITPLTLQTLSKNAVSIDMFNPEEEATISHIELGSKADVVVVAPATASIIAKMQAGFADDLASTVILATKSPVVVAPAMNVNMWENPVTVRNVESLRGQGVEFVEPEEGELACGWNAKGRLASIDKIVEAVRISLGEGDLKGYHVVVTAGPTREPIDPVRFVSNRSSGKMGYAIAQAAIRRGAKVTLISGPTAIKPPLRAEVHPIITAEEMKLALWATFKKARGDNASKYVLIMSAAVSDHRPKEALWTKRKTEKGIGFNLEMVANPDILAEFGAARDKTESDLHAPLKIVGFAAETGGDEEIISYARGKLKTKRCDMIVANGANEALEKDTNRVFFVHKGGRVEEMGTATKNEVANELLNRVVKL